MNGHKMGGGEGLERETMKRAPPFASDCSVRGLTGGLCRPLGGLRVVVVSKSVSQVPRIEALVRFATSQSTGQR